MNLRNKTCRRCGEPFETYSKSGQICPRCDARRIFVLEKKVMGLTKRVEELEKVMKEVKKCP